MRLPQKSTVFTTLGIVGSAIALDLIVEGLITKFGLTENPDTSIILGFIALLLIAFLGLRQ